MDNPQHSLDAVAFTPGPWEALKGVEQSDDMRCGVGAVRGDYRFLVATIENGAPGDFCDTEFANARLIAAAPSLYGDAEFLCARIRELEAEMTDDDELSRQYFGHVLPAVARMESSLTKARGSNDAQP